MVAATNEVVLLDETAEARDCDALRSSREAIGCYRVLLEPYDWQVMIYHARGITGDNDTYVPDHRAVLQDMVERCELGRTLLSYATDGVAYLYIGEGGLGDDQIACVRTFERPGLFLQEAMTF